jgi:hypothetical protein
VEQIGRYEMELEESRNCLVKLCRVLRIWEDRIMLKWLKDLKDDVRQRTDDEIMKAIDLLEQRVPQNESESKAIKLMKDVYFYELQERNWRDMEE